MSELDKIFENGTRMAEAISKAGSAMKPTVTEEQLKSARDFLFPKIIGEITESWMLKEISRLAELLAAHAVEVDALVAAAAVEMRQNVADEVEKLLEENRDWTPQDIAKAILALPIPNAGALERHDVEVVAAAFRLAARELIEEFSAGIPEFTAAMKAHDAVTAAMARQMELEWFDDRLRQLRPGKIGSPEWHLGKTVSDRLAANRAALGEGRGEHDKQSDL